MKQVGFVPLVVPASFLCGGLDLFWKRKFARNFKIKSGPPHKKKAGVTNGMVQRCPSQNKPSNIASGYPRNLFANQPLHQIRQIIIEPVFQHWLQHCFGNILNWNLFRLYKGSVQIIKSGSYSALGRLRNEPRHFRLQARHWRFTMVRCR